MQHMLIAIRPSDEDVKTGSPLGAFRERRLMSTPGFPFTLPPFRFMSYHNETDTLILETLNLQLTSSCNMVSRSGAEIENGHEFYLDTAPGHIIRRTFNF